MALNTDAIDASIRQRRSALEQIKLGSYADEVAGNIKKAILSGKEHEYGIASREAVTITQLEAYMFVSELNFGSLYEHVLGGPVEAMANIDNISRLLPPTPGIYFICANSVIIERQDVLYVGMTEAGFDRRLSSAHHALNKIFWDKKYRNSILSLKYVSLYSDMDVREIESAAISYFDAPVNVAKSFPDKKLMEDFIYRVRLLFNEKVD
jgi:hypothetical protein